MWRIFPASRKSRSAPTWSSNGAFGPDGVQLVEVDAVDLQPA